MSRTIKEKPVIKLVPGMKAKTKKRNGLNSFGVFLVKRRTELGITRYGLSVKMKVHPMMTHRWEKEGMIPDINSVRKLAKVLELSDRKIRQELAKAEIRRVLEKYGFLSAADPTKAEIKIISKQRPGE